MDRTLPHNLEAEKCVLGAILINNPAFNQAAEVIDAQDFFRDAHRRIFDKMVALSERNEPVDLVTLKDELTHGEIEEVGGPAYIASLTDGVPRSANVEYYAKIVKEKSTLRRLIQSGTEMLARAYDAEEDADDLLDEAERSIFGSRTTSCAAVRAERHGQGRRSDRGLQETKASSLACPVGLSTWTGSRAASRNPTWSSCGAAFDGQNELMLNIGLHAAIGRQMVGIFSLEMTKDQLFLRMLTSEARVDAHRFRGGFLGEDDYNRLVAAFARMHDAKVFIDDSAAVGILEMRAKARRLKLEHGLDLLVVDYLQLMQARGRFDNRQQELASISRSLKLLAKDQADPRAQSAEPGARPQRPSAAAVGPA
jgi:replicative DNA helicase